MTNITYDRDELVIVAVGHAMAGTEGNDLICASISMLFHTLRENVEAMKRDGRVRFSICDLRSGSAYICADGYTDEIRSAFDHICRGFAFLHENFPEFVNYTVKG